MTHINYLPFKHHVLSSVIPKYQKKRCRKNVSQLKTVFTLVLIGRWILTKAVFTQHNIDLIYFSYKVSVFITVLHC